MNNKDEEEENQEEVSSDCELLDFECKYCKFQTEDLDKLDEHIINLHSYEEEASEREIPPDPLALPSSPSEDPVYAIDDSSSADEIYVCHVCNYETAKAKVMRKHLLIHEAPYDVVYKCAICSYETRRKCDMPKHLLSHCTNVEMYKCPECPYATKRKNDLPKHLLCHKKTSEMDLYECEYCGYCSKRKGDLRKHTLTHKDAKTVYGCTECIYSTVRQADLYKHTLVHCDKEIAGIFKCLKCDFATDKTNKFAKHILSNCQICDNSVIPFTNDEYIILEGSIQEIDQNIEVPVQVVDCESQSDSVTESSNNYSDILPYRRVSRRMSVSGETETATDNSDHFTARLPYRRISLRSRFSSQNPSLSSYSHGYTVPKGYLRRNRSASYAECHTEMRESKRLRTADRVQDEDIE